MGTSHFGTVFLVDDNEHDNFIHERFIKLAGWADTVRVFSGGAELLAELPLIQPPDVMFVDLNMPGMTGFELLEQLQESDVSLDSTRVVILTSSVHPDDRSRAESTSVVSGYVQKPLGLDVLAELAIALS